MNNAHPCRIDGRGIRMSESTAARLKAHGVLNRLIDLEREIRWHTNPSSPRSHRLAVAATDVRALLSTLILDAVAEERPTTKGQAMTEPVLPLSDEEIAESIVRWFVTIDDQNRSYHKSSILAILRESRGEK